MPRATSCNSSRPNFITVLQPSPDGISIDRRAQAISIIILTPGLQEFYETNSPLQGRMVIWFCLRTNSHACTSLISFCHLDSKMIHWGAVGTNSHSVRLRYRCSRSSLSFLISHIFVLFLENETRNAPGSILLHVQSQSNLSMRLISLFILHIYCSSVLIHLI